MNAAVRINLRIVLVLALLAATAALCDGAQRPEPVLDAMTDEFELAAGRWEKNITAVALKLFFLLASIEMIWTGLTIALKGSGLQEFVAELVRRLMFIGFFLALLLHAHDWSRAIVNSFQTVGAQAVRDAGGAVQEPPGDGGEGAFKPSAIAAKGILYSRRVANSAPSIFVHPGGAVFFGFGSLAVLAGFGAIAARQVLILAEMYVVLSAGVLLLGFGATRWTNDYALKYLRYCVSVGAKLMFVQLSIALALHFLDTLMTKSSSFSFTRASSLTLSLSVLVVLIWTVPNIVAQFLQGQSATSGNEVMMASQVVNTAAANMAPGLAGGNPLWAAAKLSMSGSGLQSMKETSDPGGGLGRAMGRPLGTTRGLSRSMENDGQGIGVRKSPLKPESSSTLRHGTALTGDSDHSAGAGTQANR